MLLTEDCVVRDAQGSANNPVITLLLFSQPVNVVSCK